MKVVIVGGVAGGASTAARLRRLDERAEIVLLERGPYISFANCGLPYYIGGIISDRQKLLVTTAQSMSTLFNVDVRPDSEVVAIDRAGHKVRVRERSLNGTCHEYEESYDKLVLAPGAVPLRPRLPGIDHPRVFTVRNIPDTDAIQKFITENHPKTAVVVGGGFIGLEMAENLHRRGLQVSLVEMTPQVLATLLDPEMAAFVHHHLRAKGISLYLKNAVTGFFSQPDGSLQIALQHGSPLSTDLAILAVGVRPETALARQAGLEIGAAGGIAVDAQLQTSDPDIYAVGDAIETPDWVSGRRAPVPLAGPANRQGRTAADALAGRPAQYAGALGTAIVQVFDWAVAATGSTERSLQEAGIPFESVILHPLSHAGYYPGGTPLTIKLLFAPKDGKILGAQIVGSQGVDKRIDVLAAAMHFGASVFDLQNLELAYAPPFSSAKDPVNMAGYVAGNVVRGDLAVAHWHQVEALRAAGWWILDVRTPQECKDGQIDGAVNIPVQQLRQRLDEVPKGRPILVYCAVGLRAYLAARILQQRGFGPVADLSGGYRLYDAVTRDKSLIEEDLARLEETA